jgi:hypothetical protein
VSRNSDESQSAFGSAAQRDARRTSARAARSGAHSRASHWGVAKPSADFAAGGSPTGLALLDSDTKQGGHPSSRLSPCGRTQLKKHHGLSTRPELEALRALVPFGGQSRRPNVRIAMRWMPIRPSRSRRSRGSGEGRSPPMISWRVTAECLPAESRKSGHN